ncbi:type IV pilin N-terminal domain-containing protein [Halomontanus rarus]|uniref:type IV pilin N-terminal domain-containing protein n=1 Tax=Halomontanus rarus TaxID=3034020 RepID=UPI00307BDFBA
MQANSNRGVSPVIGTVLLIALVIITAAVVAAFTLDLAASSTDTDDPLGLEPEAEFSALHSGSTLILTHDGGEAIDAASLEIRGGPIDGSVQWGTGTVSEGDSRSVATDGSGTVEVVYRGPTDDVVVFETEL